MLLDVVGPAGTPDDGYAVGPASGTDLTIGAGTMYVGSMGGTQEQSDAETKTQSSGLRTPPGNGASTGGSSAAAWGFCTT